MSLSLSCRGRYATRAIVELANRDSDQPVPLSVISKAQGISRKYLQQLMALLNRAGLVRVVKGQRGGYLLAKPANQVTIKDVLTAVEGDLKLVECVGDHESCLRFDMCRVQWVWEGASNVLNEYFDSVTIDQLADSKAIGS
jgi:Rrf2 family protein